MNTNTTKLQQRVMRRVYYIFALRLMKHPVTVQVALFTLALLVFARLVHVSKVVDNLLSVPLGQVPQHIVNALMRGEVLTLITIGVMVFVALSVPLHFWRVVYLPKLRRQVTT